MVRVRWWMKEHRFTMFPLLSNYARLSGKIDHITDIQVTKAQTKSIPVPCWEIHYSKVNSLHSVFPCAWFPPQTGHTACRGICWDMSPKCGLTTPRLQISWGTSSQRSFTDRVLNYIHLGQEGTLWVFSCNFQSRQEPDLMWLPTNHQLGFTYQEGQKVVWKTRERPAAVSTNIQWFNHTYAVNSTKKSKNLASGFKPWQLIHHKTDCVCIWTAGYHHLSLNYMSCLPHNSNWWDHGQLILS